MMNLISKLNYIFNKKQKIRLVQLAFIITIGAFAELASVSAIMPFVDIVLNPDVILENKYLGYVYSTLHMKSINELLILWAFVLILIYILKNIYIAIMYDAQYRFVYRNQRKLSCKMLKCYMQQDYAFHLQHNSAELIRSLNNDINMFFSTILACLQLLTELTVCMTFFVFLIYQDKTITIGISIILIAFSLIFMKVYRKKAQGHGQQTRKCYAEMTKWQMQSFGGIKEIKIFHRENFFYQNFDDAYSGYAESQRKYQLMNILPRPVLEAVSISGLLGVVAFKLMRHTDLSYLIPTLTVFTFAAFRMMPSFTRITGYLNTILFNKVSVDAVYDDLKGVEQLEKSLYSQQISDEPIELKKEIKVEGLSFHYQDSDENVLENVNLSIPKNKSVAFIGPSGAGKTTLVDIILGVLNPVSGHVLVDGIDIQTNKAEWFAKLGYIPQMIYIMDNTLKSNVAFGIPEEDIDETRLQKAIENAQLKTFVDTLDDGLDTMIGENGMRLSGGQRQRIGIARALYNEPEVLILDEATSALDSDTEAAVMEAIDRLAGQKTMIIIAHRLTTIKNCDIIYQVESKKVQWFKGEKTDLLE